MHRIVPAIFILIYFIHIPGSKAQSIKPQGGFLQDSMKVGEEVTYTLSIKYPRELNVIFPDSLYNFSPFEFSKKAFFNTSSDSLFSYDSAVYTLSSFEIDKVQSLALPVFLLDKGDSAILAAEMDSIFLQELISQMPDSVALKENTGYRAVGFQFNYPYFIIGIVILAVLCLLVLLIFGKTIRKKIKIYRLKQSHKKFVTLFNNLLSGAQISATTAESILIAWKKYMEGLERVPYTKLTTKEIIKRQPNDQLSVILKTIDRSIYGHGNLNEIDPSFAELKDFADDSLMKKMEEINNG
ncbi:hypothetical protein QQ008_14530 [Fulvivirgaceae bacterium BMA10]|uniref:DUF4129 domain-containing protein n=1 Tax=Splendidivirga corallicola TaxID=3051826 RepID=A0ABT8KPG5_9BACT|nr:hypothetical protein [Fulvivirgaceae bacterium BMA10]